MVVKIADTEKEKERKKMEKVQQTPQMGVNFALGNPLGLYPVSEVSKIGYSQKFSSAIT